MPQNALTLLEILRDLLLGAAAGLAGGFVRWNNPERRRFGWCLAWEVPSAALPGTDPLTQGQVAELLLAYDAAHADCAGRLAAVRRLNTADGAEP